MEKSEKDLYIPIANYTDPNESESIKTQPIETKRKFLRNDTCPCCDNLTIPIYNDEVSSIAFICPVCYWEIDLFIKNQHEKSDQNHGLTLAEARLNYKSFGACDKQMLQYVLTPEDD